MTIQNDIPDPPFTLRERGALFWAEVYRLLNHDGKLEAVDLFLLARYCDALAEWEELNDWSRANEPFKEMISSKGVAYFAKHPKISRLETLEPHLLRMEKALGIGAKSRGKVGGGGPAKGGELDQWLKRTLGKG